ncbi:hypothetical protein [Maritalea porphyrae]|uniref:Porin n=1 Tax=Maritalea porphyrae TaxID=880732 RepID=A0ABQ5USI4_9HYPH|nr:hypothetical protein [Maritalea porphyrae]GLQ18076.1 hypothetical protein GCM10007879_23250 [Maritalea porphyrae]
MRRLGFGLMVSVAALGCASQALAADLDYPEMRGSYNSWDESMSPDMEFEAGVRYWYSMGSQDVGLFGYSFNASDTSHIAEGYLRLNDLATNSYLKAYGGYSALISGDYTNTATPSSGAIIDGRVAYAVVDFGYQPLVWEEGETRTGFGGIVGYQYWNDSPDMGRANYAAIDSASDVSWSSTTGEAVYGGDSSENDISINALRLGVSGDADFGAFSISGEVAAIPYAMISGTTAATLFPTVDAGSYVSVQSGPTTFEGVGYGAAGELMVGTKMDNWNFRVGGRAWYLNGRGEARYEVATITDATDTDTDSVYETDGSVTLQDYVSDIDAFSMWRYGILAEISVDF